MDRLLRSASKWLLLLFVATVALSVVREQALGARPTAGSWLVLVLLSFLLFHLLRPLWRAWRWWKRRHPARALRPELPAAAQWVTPRERRRTHDLR